MSYRRRSAVFGRPFQRPTMQTLSPVVAVSKRILLQIDKAVWFLRKCIHLPKFIIYTCVNLRTGRKVGVGIIIIIHSGQIHCLETPPVVVVCNLTNVINLIEDMFCLRVNNLAVNRKIYNSSSDGPQSHSLKIREELQLKLKTQTQVTNLKTIICKLTWLNKFCCKIPQNYPILIPN